MRRSHRFLKWPQKPKQNIQSLISMSKSWRQIFRTKRIAKVPAVKAPTYPNVRSSWGVDPQSSLEPIYQVFMPERSCEIWNLWFLALRNSKDCEAWPHFFHSNRLIWAACKKPTPVTPRWPCFLFSSCCCRQEWKLICVVAALTPWNNLSQTGNF